MTYLKMEEEEEKYISAALSGPRMVVEIQLTIVKASQKI
jgi:hypothetical protein